MVEFIENHQKLSEVINAIGKGDSDTLHIVVVFGGISAEREPSLLSAKNLLTSIKDMNYRITPVDMGVDIAEVLRKLNPDVVFNMLHGTYGEDGCIQGVLEILGIPYTHSGLLSSAIALDKIYSQQLFIQAGIKCPKRVVINQGDDLSHEPISRPYVIKPVNQGSSLGVEVIFAEDAFDLNKYHFDFGNQIIIEEYITGKEVQVAVLDGKAVGTLEVVLLKNKRFNDYECKYTEGFCQHICPAELSDNVSKRMMQMAELAHNIINCRGITRAEFIYNKEKDEIYFLEINTHPGLTQSSFVPDILKHNNISMSDLFNILIEEAIS
jgi:D-alanine-D-alanine ligase